MKIETVKLASLAILLGAAVPANADLIENGGFEDPEIASGTYALYDMIPGWYLVGEGDIEIQNNVAGSPYEGDQFVELDSTQPSTIGQDVTTVGGQQYTLSFAFAGRPGTNLASDNVMRVTWGGIELFNMAAPDFTPNWTVYSFDVTAASALTTLTFGDLSVNAQNSYGVYLDDVRLVRKIPEPATLGLLGLGLLGIGLSRRRRA